MKPIRDRPSAATFTNCCAGLVAGEGRCEEKGYVLSQRSTVQDKRGGNAQRSEHNPDRLVENISPPEAIAGFKRAGFQNTLSRPVLPADRHQSFETVVSMDLLAPLCIVHFR